MSKILSAKFFISDEEYKEVLEYLQQHYPSCFKADRITPLAVGISNQIFAINSPYSKVKIRRFLRRYTKSAKYRKNLMIGANRYNLDGSISSQVLEEEVNKSKWNELKDAKKSLKIHD